MTVDNLLSRLDKAKATGPNRWIAYCPVHSYKSPSSTHDVLAAIGMEFADLYPETERRPFPAGDILRCLAHEALIVSAAVGALQESQPLSDLDYERLNLAVQRIQAAITASGVSQNG